MNSNWTWDRILVAALLVIVVVIVAYLAMCPSTPEQPRTYCDDIDASVAAEQYIERLLKSPSTAEFGPYRSSNVHRYDGRVSYTGYVDAQNTFGAMLRKEFTVEMECRGGGLVVVDSKFEQP